VRERVRGFDDGNGGWHTESLARYPPARRLPACPILTQSHPKRQEASSDCWPLALRMDLIGVEPTTSSMPWNSRSLVLMRGMGSPVIEPVYIANVDEVNRGQRRPKGSEWGQRAKVWAFSPSTGPS
jgi:hypothetical protein